MAGATRRLLTWLSDSFASNVMGYVRFGFAAGCEAVAMPRRQQLDYFRATPVVRASPSDFVAEGRTKG